MTRFLEVCVDELAGVRAAFEGGADRIELCSRLDLDGLTPGDDLLADVATCPVPVRAMIRPDPGPFTATMAQLSAMVAQIDQARAAGCEGVVFGLLDDDGALAEADLARLCAAADGMGKTLHRAIDLLPDPSAALPVAETLGFDTILSSGGASSATKGARMLAAMARAAPGLTIMPGAGISTGNIAQISRETGAQWLHGSFRGDDGKTSAARIAQAKSALLA